MVLAPSQTYLWVKQTQTDSKIDSKTPLCRTHLLKVVHISLKYLHTPLFGSKWPDIPDPHYKQSKTVMGQRPPENPAGISVMSMTNAVFPGRTKANTVYYKVDGKALFFRPKDIKCIQIPLTGSKDTVESGGGRKGKCQMHCWGFATESSWV